MCVFRCVGNGVSKRVLNVLKSVYLSLRKVEVQRVTVVKFGMYNVAMVLAVLKSR